VVEKVEITRVDTSRVPPRATVDITLRGIRYLEDRRTLALLGGSRSDEDTFAGIWTLALDGPDTAPWRIETVRDVTDEPGDRARRKSE
jgi:predicted lipid-binding transport protein (Tim44 family)